MNEIKHIKMKCIMESSDNGLNWKISRVDYLSSGLTQFHQHEFENNKDAFLGLSLKVNFSIGAKP